LSTVLANFNDGHGFVQILVGPVSWWGTGLYCTATERSAVQVQAGTVGLSVGNDHSKVW